MEKCGWCLIIVWDCFMEGVRENWLIRCGNHETAAQRTPTTGNVINQSYEVSSLLGYEIYPLFILRSRFPWTAPVTEQGRNTHSGRPVPGQHGLLWWSALAGGLPSGLPWTIWYSRTFTQPPPSLPRLGSDFYHGLMAVPVFPGSSHRHFLLQRYFP